MKSRLHIFFAIALVVTAILLLIRKGGKDGTDPAETSKEVRGAIRSEEGRAGRTGSSNRLTSGRTRTISRQKNRKLPDWVFTIEGMGTSHLGKLDEPFDADRLAFLAKNPKSERFELKILICRAAAAKDSRFRYLLEQEGLRDDPWVDIALEAYDYAVNENGDALDRLLEIHAAEAPGSDSDSVLVLSFLDEWERTIPAVLKHFERGTDGTGGIAQSSFWSARKVLFPENFDRLLYPQ